MSELPAGLLRSALQQAGVPEGLETSATILASDETGWMLSRGISLALGREAPEDHGPVSRGGTTVALPVLTLAMGPLGEGGGEDPAMEADLEVQGLLAEGGMGRLLLARQRSLGREVVVKQVRPSILSPELIRSLLSEARITGSLEHPGIVPVHALGLDRGGRPLMVMKRIEGVLWSDLVRNEGHPAWGRLLSEGRGRREVHLRILSSVCDALAFAHSRGVLHRDIKCDNVMVGYFGEAYLLDWGIALRSGEPRGPGPLVGTPAYLAPEMVSGDTREVDERTDVYLLGATLYQVLSGHLRHRGRSLEEALASALASAPPSHDPTTPPDLAALCDRATARDPARRPPSAQAFREALDVHLRRSDVVALVDRAEATLAEAAEELRGLGGEPRWSLQRRLVEGRFALEQALRTWPEAPRALGLLDRCRELQLAQALALANLAEARMFAAELAAPPEELKARLQALEAEVIARQEASSELKSLREGLDHRVNDDTRYLVFSLIGLLIVGATVALEYLPRGQALPVYGGVLAGSLGLAVGLRRRLVNRINRKVVECFLAYMVLLVVHQGGRALLGSPGPLSLEGDVQAALSAAIAVAVTLHPLFWSVAAVMALCWALMLAYPGQQLLVVRGTGLAMAGFLGILGGWLRWRRGRQARDGSCIPGARGEK